MRFYDRENELAVLKENKERSKEAGVFTVITGRRRIGKTALIKESEKNDRFLYFFADRSSEALLCEQLASDAERDLGIELTDSGRFRDLFRELMEYGKNNEFTFVIDEFQELEKANKAIISGIQNLWDTNRPSSKVNLIVCGSVHSMMVRIFEGGKEPLFGRAAFKFKLRPFRPSVIRTILSEHNAKYEPDDLLLLYMVTGGIPKYIEALMDAKATTFEKILNAVCSPGSLFLTEGKDLLISEFGRNYGTYFSILGLISRGMVKEPEISTVIGKECGPYLEKLENEYDLVKKNRPLTSGGNSRDVRWKMTDNYLRFYFRYLSKNQSLIEREEYGLLKKIIKEDYTQYSGHVLEDYFKEKMSEDEEFTDIGSYWDRKGDNEIDIVALNDLDKKAVFAEVKRNPDKADIDGLRKKAGTVSGLKGYETEYRVLSLKDM